jgi:leucyl-tRNA synthetase
MDASCQRNAGAKALRYAAHSLIEKAQQEYEGRYAFNTVIAKCMELVNDIRAFITAEKLEGVVKGANDPTLASRWMLCEAFNILNRVLAPIAPHTAEEAHKALGGKGSIFDQPWPKADPQALVLDEIELPVQVNGKVRGTIRVPRDADTKALEAAALANEGVKKMLEGKTVKKLIAVPGKIVNVVVG